METAVLILSYAIVIFFGLMPIVRKKHTGEIFVFVFLTVLSAGILIFKLFIAPDSKSLAEIITNMINSFISAN